MSDESYPDDVEGGPEQPLLMPGQKWIFRARRMEPHCYTNIQGSRLFRRWIKVATGRNGYLRFFCPGPGCEMHEFPLRIEPLGLSTNRRRTPGADGTTVVLGAWCPGCNEPVVLRIKGPDSEGDWV